MDGPRAAVPTRAKALPWGESPSISGSERGLIRLCSGQVLKARCNVSDCGGSENGLGQQLKPRRLADCCGMAEAIP